MYVSEKSFHISGTLFCMHAMPLYPVACAVFVPIVVLLCVTGVLVNIKSKNNLKNPIWDILPLLKILTGHPVRPHPT